MGMDELIRQVSSGRHVKYLHFWGHAPRKDGRMGPSCLSQWWEAPFEVDGVRYATAEHWMMAHKARLFGDAEAERKALDAANPGAAKRAGRGVRGFDDRSGSGSGSRSSARAACTSSRSMRRCGSFCWPRETGCSSRPARWTGSGVSDWPRTTNGQQDPTRWRGQNLLGFALMEAREELRAAGEQGS